MDNQTLLQPLYDLVSQVEGLLQLAQAENWNELKLQADLYQQHVRFLDDDLYLKALHDANLVEDAKAIIVRVQTLNDDLDLQASRQRERIASELRQVIHSEKAIDAYSR